MNVIQNSTVFLLQHINSHVNYNKIGHSKEKSPVSTKVLGEEKGLISMGKTKSPVIPISSLYVDDTACDLTCSWGPIKKKNTSWFHLQLHFLIQLVNEISLF